MSKRTLQVEFTADGTQDEHNPLAIAVTLVDVSVVLGTILWSWHKNKKRLMGSAATEQPPDKVTKFANPLGDEEDEKQEVVEADANKPMKKAQRHIAKKTKEIKDADKGENMPVAFNGVPENFDDEAAFPGWEHGKPIDFTSALPCGPHVKLSVQTAFQVRCTQA
eukprot:COSAG05_NODE_1215_length_5490_cov_153.169542_2_plen_165_part_00